MTNTFGTFAKASMMAEAESVGVKYDGSDDKPPFDTHDIVDVEEDSRVVKFFHLAISIILFWR